MRGDSTKRYPVGRLRETVNVRLRKERDRAFDRRGDLDQDEWAGDPRVRDFIELAHPSLFSKTNCMIEGFPDGEAHHRKFMHAVKGWLNPDITVNDSDMKRCFRDAITEAYGLTSFPRVSPTSTAYDPRALRFFRRRNDRSATRPSHFVARAAQEETPADELPRAARLTKPERHAFIECLKGLPIPIDGTLGFDQVEVTAGGLSLRELNPRSLEVNRRPGLYVCGELLDLNGPMGGFSFLAAWATAEMVGAALSSDTS